jgi:hypothetical protein
LIEFHSSKLTTDEREIKSEAVAMAGGIDTEEYPKLDQSGTLSTRALPSLLPVIPPL